MSVLFLFNERRGAILIYANFLIVLLLFLIFNNLDLIEEYLTSLNLFTDKYSEYNSRTRYNKFIVRSFITQKEIHNIDKKDKK